MLDDAYSAGRKAYFRNLAPYEDCCNQNPFTEWSFNWTQWMAGFMDAEDYDFLRDVEDASQAA